MQPSRACWHGRWALTALPARRSPGPRRPGLRVNGRGRAGRPERPSSGRLLGAAPPLETFGHLSSSENRHRRRRQSRRPKPVPRAAPERPTNAHASARPDPAPVNPAALCPSFPSDPGAKPRHGEPCRHRTTKRALRGAPGVRCPPPQNVSRSSLSCEGPTRQAHPYAFLGTALRCHLAGPSFLQAKR